MSDWDKIAADAAIEYAKPTTRPVQTMSDHMADAFHEGARWQREALLSEETVMRAARAVYESAPNTWTWTWAEIVGGWKNKPYPDYPHLVDDIRRQARAALAAALGEDEGDE